MAELCGNTSRCRITNAFVFVAVVAVVLNLRNLTKFRISRFV